MSNHIFPVVTEIEKGLPLYLTGVGCHYRQEHVKRPEGYPTFQWIQCYNGEGELLLRNDRYLIGPQQGMFLYPNVAHEYYEIKAPWEVYWIGFDGYLVEHLTNTLGFEESGVFHIINGDLVLGKMRRALTVAQSNEYFRGLECSNVVYELLLDLFRYISHSNDDSIQQQYLRLQPVFDYIEDNFSQVITLENLADTINVTPQHFCLLFKNVMKIRPFEYLNQVRINKSKDLMFAGRNLELKTIAKSVGYESGSYFCVVFKQIEGISPGQFQKLHGIF
jgi:AraC family transcriptional regulator, arabinose operon regulatory protein